jgi:signal transduction histidine kinase
VEIANRAGALLLAGALVVLIFMVFVIRRDQAADDALANRSSHISAVNEATEAALSALKDAETGQRGYLITGKQDYLEPYDAGLRSFDAELSTLRQLTATEPEMAALIAQIASLADLKKKELATTIDLFRTKGQAAAFARVSEDLGKRYMDEIRMISARIVTEENAAYERSRQAAAESETSTRRKSLASAVVLFLLTFTGTLLLSLQIRSERRLAATLESSEKKYRELAESLEDQVARRTYELEQLNRELEQVNRELEQLNQELMAFSYSVSHDLRAPLRSIDGLSEIVLEDYSDRLDENGRNLLQRIRQAARHMSHLIHSMLELSRVTRQELDRQSVSITDMATASLRHLMAVSPDRKIAFSVAPGLQAEGDPHLIRVVLDNLLANAWKFTSKTESASIEVGQTDVDGKPAFFVRDNGSGFDPVHASKLFRPFQRLHSETEFEGTGIGLATVQRIVNRHGGRVWAEGRPNEGATFFFALS